MQGYASASGLKIFPSVRVYRGEIMLDLRILSYSFSSFPQKAAVAQLDRASDYGSEGSAFESRRLHHLKPAQAKAGRVFCCLGKTPRVRNLVCETTPVTAIIEESVSVFQSRTDGCRRPSNAPAADHPHACGECFEEANQERPFRTWADVPRTYFGWMMTAVP